MEFEPDPGFAEPPLGYRPPPSEAGRDRLARLRLIRSRRVGPATFRRLMAEHGSAEAALEALPDVAAQAGVETYSPCSAEAALAEMKAAERAGARLICLGDAAYPTLLAEESQAPPILWTLGRLELLQRPVLAIIGTRNASSLGTRMARRLSQDLGAAGFVIVSGLARGIDAIAHEAALQTGTIGVHAGGVDVIYPAENTNLAGDMAKSGLRLSEMPFGLAPQGRHFPLRNRIVAGLAQAVIVIEAAGRSGSLITARAALDMGRDVMAVPGHPMDTRASGCNMLIRDGATLVRSAEDVLEALAAEPVLPLEPSAPPVSAQPTPPSTTLTADILALLGPSPSPEDQLIADLAQPPQAVAAALAEMELAGQIERRPGGVLALPA